MNNDYCDGCRWENTCPHDWEFCVFNPGGDNDFEDDELDDELYEN